MITEQERKVYDEVNNRIALAGKYIAEGWPDETILAKLQEAFKELASYRGSDKRKAVLAYHVVLGRAHSLVTDLGHLQDGRKVLEEGLGKLRLEPAGARWK